MQHAAEQKQRPEGVPSSKISGLHALVEIARDHGVHLSVEQIIRDFGATGSEPSVAKLARIAEGAGLKARPVKLAWHHLGRLGLALPVLLRLRDGQALIVTGFHPGASPPVAMLRNPLAPNAPELAVDEVRLKSVWDGEALLLKRRYGINDEEAPFGFGWMFRQVLRERRMFRDIAIAALALSVLALAPPLFYMAITDRVLVYHRISTLTVLAGGIVFALFFDTVFGYLRRYLVTTVTARIDARVSTYIFDRMIKLPIDFFDRNSAGAISHKLNEVRKVRAFLTGQLFGTLLDTVNLAVLLPAMFLISPLLSCYVLGLAAVMSLVVALYLAPMSRGYARVMRSENAKHALLIESIQGMRTIKSLALEGTKRREWDARIAEAVRASTALQFLSNQPQTILAPLEKLIYAGSLAVGAYLAITYDAAIYAGTLVAFTMIANRATQPLLQISSMMQQVQEARGAVAEVASIVNQKSERSRTGGARPRVSGAMEFSELRFKYPGATSFALDGVSFSVKAGSIVGIMGRSGSGKTTITRLLQGLHEGYEGLIKLDGTDIREIDLDHLRSSMGVVLQDSFLFHGTIRDNIVAGRAGITLEAAIEAARLAGAEEFIERLPRGYETVIEEGSSNLSGGQRQRLAIARALVGNPPVLVFDEATSALDPDSEAIISNNLRGIAASRTVIMITHRLASLVACDEVLVLERGRLLDAGRHGELLARCEIYRHLWFQQNRHLQPEITHETGTIGPKIGPARSA